MGNQQVVTTDQTTNQQEGIGPEVWTKYIPEDLRDKGYWEPVKNADLSTVLKNYGHAQEKLGKTVFSIPDNPDDAESWSKIYDKLGRPKSPDDYKYELPKIDGQEWNQETIKDFNRVAHKIGLTNKQAQEFMKWLGSDLNAKLKAHTEAKLQEAATTEAKLKREFGKDYDARIALAKRAGALYFGQESVETWFDAMPEPVIRGLMKLGEQLAEDKVFGTNPPEMQGITTKEEALRRIAEIGSDRNHPYWSRDRNDPRYKAAVEEMAQLHHIAYGT
jgi:hypothetical protein